VIKAAAFVFALTIGASAHAQTVVAPPAPTAAAPAVTPAPAPPKPRESAAALVARLVSKGCMRIVENTTAEPVTLVPAGGTALNAAQKKTIGMDPRSQAWTYVASNDVVALEVGPEGCNVFTQSTGDESYLKVLEDSVSAVHPRMYVELDEAGGGDKLRWRNYMVPLAADGTGKGPVQALSVTYATAETKAAGRTFFVGVLPSLRRE